MIAPHHYYPVKKLFQEYKWEGKKIIATVSGGSDSMALCYVLQNLHVDFVIAHCNFHLRGAESDEDARFVAQWAKDNHIPCFVKDFDMPALLANGGNLQDLCRVLRYEWFETLRKELNFDVVATAHHKNDVAETVLMNLMKGTGIAGLHGILPQNGSIIRPLLTLTKVDLLELLAEQKATWREDSSNNTDKYTRNKIRHHLLPSMQEILPQAIDGIAQTSDRMKDIEAMVMPLLIKQKNKLLEQRGRDYYISLNKLKLQPGYKTILFEIVKDFGFSSSQMTDLIALLDAATGKFIFSDTHQLIKNRAFFIITTKATVARDYILIEQFADDAVYDCPVGRLSLSSKEADQSADNLHIAIDADLLTYPLVLRPIKEGDYLYPIGMGMKKKKVSKLLKDLKIPIHEKQYVWILESQQKIVWVIGCRMDERFKVTPSTKQVLHLNFERH